jgi:hypothetical protein
MKLLIMQIKKNVDTLIDDSKEAGVELAQRKLSICCYLITRMQGKIVT